MFIISFRITLQLYSSSLKNFINIFVSSSNKFNLLLKSSNFISLFHFSLLILLEFSFKMDSHSLDKSYKLSNTFLISLELNNLAMLYPLLKALNFSA